MTDPVILLGTQSNGETLPVQVNEFGQLVAEGLPGTEGPEGPEGPQGPEGPPGPSFELPPDPYEGALLGWLNNELAWVGTPPVPIPEGIFGPITDWDSASGLLTVDGEIPDVVASGVYIYQCDETGEYFAEGWNVSEEWSAMADHDTVGTTNNLIFDGDSSTCNSFAGSDGDTTIIFSLASLSPGSEVKITTRQNSDAGDIICNGTRISTKNNNKTKTTCAQLTGSVLVIRQETNPGTQSRDDSYIYEVEVAGQVLVDFNQRLGMRVGSVIGNVVAGNSTSAKDFTLGKYLKTPIQKVAPWVLYGNDPTSLIDHLRSS